MNTLLSTFKALADRNRLRIVAALMQHEELCACQLTELLGVAGATSSRHLSQLQHAKIVIGRKEGRWNFFRLNPELSLTFPLSWLEEALIASGDAELDREALALILLEKPEAICRRQRGDGILLEEEQFGTVGRDGAKQKVLFLCTGNSCRSQMAEGWARQLISDRFDVFSAGIETHGLNPSAVLVMGEVGVDISSYVSKNLDEFDLGDIDYIITVCGHAQESCPIIPSHCRKIHNGFDDPPKLAESLETEEEKLECYRKVRDEIKAFIEKLPGSLPVDGG